MIITVKDQRRRQRRRRRSETWIKHLFDGFRLMAGRKWSLVASSYLPNRSEWIVGCFRGGGYFCGVLSWFRKFQRSRLIMYGDRSGRTDRDPPFTCYFLLDCDLAWEGFLCLLCDRWPIAKQVLPMQMMCGKDLWFTRLNGRVFEYFIVLQIVLWAIRWDWISGCWRYNTFL